VPAYRRPEGDPAPLPYLLAAQDQESGGFEVTLVVFLRTRRMREAANAPFLLSRGNLRDAYWTVAQMLTHHASNGCNMLPGDLFATGTISGEAKESWGSLLELTRRGAEPIRLPTGEERRFLEDGDEIVMRGRAERDGFVAIGFGEGRGVIEPARGSA
jgi:fumarylacetoacetase